MTLVATEADKTVAFSIERKMLDFLRKHHDPNWEHSRSRIISECSDVNVNLAETRAGDLENLTLRLSVEIQSAPGNSNDGISCTWTKLKYDESKATFQIFAFPRLKRCFMIETFKVRGGLGPSQKIQWQRGKKGKQYTSIWFEMFPKWGATELPWDLIFGEV